MLIDANEIHEHTSFVTDICILGGGVAGIVLAKELSPDGRGILILESGDDEYQQATQDLYKADKVPDVFPDPATSRLRFLGGNSNHWENSVERLDPIDFDKRPWVKNSGWPINFSEIEPYYPLAEKYCGVGTDGFDIEHWKKQINFDDIFLDSDYFDTAISKSAEAPTRFYKKYGDDLISHKNIRLIKNANFTDIDFDSDNNTISSVEFSSLNMARCTVKADIFIMCLGGIENARMLLIFNEKYNDSLGNKHDNVGRYLMEHPTIRAAHFYPLTNRLSPIYSGILSSNKFIHGRGKLNASTQFKEQTNNLRLYFSARSRLELSHGISSSHIVSQHLSDGTIPDDFGSHLANILKDLDIIYEAYLRKNYDSSFIEDADMFHGYQITSMIEQTPDHNNRVYLGESRDDLNLKRLLIDYQISHDDKMNAMRTLDLLSRDASLQKFGRTRVLNLREERIWSSQLGFGSHHMGTTRMGHNEKDGVVDSDCKVFGTKNFYLAGSSVFPTGGHVPPTLTIVALTLKLADRIRTGVSNGHN